jgi:hypothetical protein
MSGEQRDFELVLDLLHSMIQLVAIALYSSLLHTPAFSTMVFNSPLVTAYNGGRWPFFGFPNCSQSLGTETLH